MKYYFQFRKEKFKEYPELRKIWHGIMLGKNWVTPEEREEFLEIDKIWQKEWEWEKNGFKMQR